MSHSNICDLTAENLANEETVAEAPENSAESKIDLPAATLYDLEEMDFAEPPKKRWKIADDSAADWAIRKIAKEREELERLEALAKAETDRINEKLEAARRRYENGTAFLTDCLAAYFRTVEPKKTKTKASYRLLSGTLTNKFGGLQMKPNDEALLEYLKENGGTEFIKIEEKLNWAELKKQLHIVGDKVVNKETGEMFAGVEIVTKPDNFVVEF